MNKLILNKYYSLNAESYVSVEVCGAYGCIPVKLCGSGRCCIKY